jgi:hypothetical protein
VEVKPAALVVGGAALLLFLKGQDAAADGAGVGDLIMGTLGLNGGTVTPKIQNFARAIATAEGFYVPNSIPRLANNPGNLVIPSWSGRTMGSERISVFSSVEEGWGRLYRQLSLIVNGQSRVYSLDMTITDMGNKWAPGGAVNVPGAWASNVARVLEVSPMTRLRSLLV